MGVPAVLADAGTALTDNGSIFDADACAGIFDVGEVEPSGVFLVAMAWS